MEKAESCSIEVRVRYSECDPQRVAHHSVWPVWFELARTELLALRGHRYRDLEVSGTHFVVDRLAVRYREPARYDDLLRVTCRVKAAAGVKIEHVYEVRRVEETHGPRRDAVGFEGGELLGEGETAIVCLDDAGKMQRVPADLL